MHSFLLIHSIPISSLSLSLSLSLSPHASPKQLIPIRLADVQKLPLYPIRVLILVWSDDQKEFAGLVPQVQEQEKFNSFLTNLEVWNVHT